MSSEQNGLQPFIDRWGRFAVPEAEPQLIRFEQYMAWTPEESTKLELVDGRLLIGGNPEDATERMLTFMMRAFGLVHTLRLAPASAWRPALARIGITLSPERHWAVVPEPPEPAEDDPILGRRQAAMHLSIDVRVHADAVGASGQWLVGPFAVCPIAEAETVLTPDWLYVSATRKHLFHEYYLAGAPDWLLEAPWPGGLAFCRQVKLPLYFQGDAQEVWVVDWGAHAVEVYTHDAGKPGLAGRYGPGDHIRSTLFPKLSLDMDRVIREERVFGRASRSKAEESTPDLGRRAQPQPEPQPINADRFFAWQPEEWHKQEMVDGQVYIGGTHEEAERALALLLADVGLIRAVELAPPAHWEAALAVVKDL